MYLEDLSLKEMSESKNTGLNKSLRDSSLATLVMYLQYKANKVMLVNPAFTSKTCNVCGTVNTDLKLSDRTYRCHHCGNEEDRDKNAALNIHCLGKAIMMGANQGICITSLYTGSRELDLGSLRL
jgi:putative transposase